MQHGKGFLEARGQVSRGTQIGNGAFPGFKAVHSKLTARSLSAENGKGVTMKTLSAVFRPLRSNFHFKLRKKEQRIRRVPIVTGVDFANSPPLFFICISFCMS